MGKTSFSGKWGRVQVQKKAPVAPEPTKSPEESVRQMKQAQKSAADDDYREKALAMHGLLCA
ncbi:MAG TPA: hypothetical protein PKZ12_02285, partial [Smithellaceae bacterium]|nr:hypothetical protein [Smithellaceae bacterium]